MSQTTRMPMHLAGAWDVYPSGTWGKRVRHALKEAIFACYLYCGVVQLRDWVLSLAGCSRIVILYYHRVGWMDVVSKPTAQFREEMRYLAEHYDCLTMRELVERFRDHTPRRRKIAVVTFDDGYRDNFTNALPELQKAGVPATFFVSTGYVGTRRTFPHDTRALEHGRSVRDDWEKLRWEDLRVMQAAGMEIASHTVEHLSMGREQPAVVRREILNSLDRLQAELGKAPRCFSFPWGKSADVTDAAIKAVREAGYYAAVTTSPGVVHRGDDLFRLRRIDVGNGQASRLAAFAVIEGFGQLFRWLPWRG